mmetsp:Transcript_16680/g.15043  ORF Transcript_16680/g.15043 Transcript_16680/m.15043 type:complete len:517 (+) Transcript_16680:19-1569(+)
MWQDLMLLWRRDLLIIIWLGLVSGLSFGVVLPTLQPFVTGSNDANPPGLGQSNMFYAFVIAMFSIGEFCGSNAAGLMVRFGYSSQFSFTAMNLVGFFGSIVYSLSSKDYAFMALLGRFGTGIWSGGVNVTMRIHMNTHIAKKDLTFIMASVGFIITLAMMLSPGFQIGFDRINSRSCIPNTLLCFDTYRGPAWLISIMILISLVMVQLLFPAYNEPTNYEKVTLIEESSETYDSMAAAKAAPINTNHNLSPLSSVWDTNGVSNSIIIMLLFCFFTFSFGFTLIESMATPLMNDQLGIDIEKSSILYIISGLVSAFAFLVLLVADKKKWVSDSQATLISLVFMFLGSLILVDYQSLRSDSCQQLTCSYSASSSYCINGQNVTTLASTCLSTKNCAWNQEFCTICPPVCHDPSKTLSIAQLYIGFVLFNVQYVLGRICSAAIYSKLMPYTRQGWMQSVLMSSGTIARVIAPIVAISTYQGTSYHTFGLMFAMLGLSTVCLVWFYYEYKHLTEAINLVN